MSTATRIRPSANPAQRRVDAYTRRLLVALDRLDSARAQFFALAEEAGDMAGDAAWDAGFASAQAELTRAEREVSSLRPSPCVPLVRGGSLYRIEGRRVRVEEVAVLPGSVA